MINFKVWIKVKLRDCPASHWPFVTEIIDPLQTSERYAEVNKINAIVKKSGTNEKGLTLKDILGDDYDDVVKKNDITPLTGKVTKTKEIEMFYKTGWVVLSVYNWIVFLFRLV